LEFIKRVWSVLKTLVRSNFVEIMAILSSKVARVMFSECGISDVKMLKSVGVKILLRGTLALGKWI